MRLSATTHVAPAPDRPSETHDLSDFPNAPERPGKPGRTTIMVLFDEFEPSGAMDIEGIVFKALDLR